MTTRAATWDSRKARPRRIGLAATVVVLHVLVLQLLLSAKHTFHIAPEELKNRSITWIALSSPTTSKTRQLPVNTRGPRVRAVAVPHTPARSSSTPQVAPPATAPVQDPALAVLQQYTLCSLGSEDKRSPEEQERCAALRRGLITGPVPPHVPTEQEEATRRRLEHELAVQNAPSALPCVFSPILPACLINGLINGFGGMDSYANHPYQPSLGEQFNSHFPKPKGNPRDR